MAVTRTAPAAPVSLVVGDEEFLVERAVAGLVAAHGPGADVHDVTAAGLSPGELAAFT